MGEYSSFFKLLTQLSFKSKLDYRNPKITTLPLLIKSIKQLKI